MAIFDIPDRHRKLVLILRKQQDLKKKPDAIRELAVIMARTTISKLTLLILGLLFSCKTRQPTHELVLNEYMTPPGTIKIDDNLFLDQTEVTNISYLEFIYWTNMVQGNPEYKSILPDTSAWKFLTTYKYEYPMPEYYLRHPAYRQRPVVGISYQQATKFCKWRSDRVMEFILIKKGLIPHKLNPPKDSAFTIEKYFSGKYYNIKPSPYIKYYPVYSLPDSLTYIKALKFADSLNKVNLKYCGDKKCKCEFSEPDTLLAKDILEIRCIETIPEKTEGMPYGLEPTKKTYCSNCTKPLITDLLGNVRELTTIPSVTFGGSYIDSCSTIKTKYFYHKKGTNAYTGFRNICVWHKWP
jgi:hypothetical protein